MADITVTTAIDEARERVPAVLRALKALYRMTDAELSARVGMSRSAVRERMSGTTQGTPAELAGFAKVFGVTPDVFYLDPGEALARATANPEALRVLDERFLPIAVGDRRALKPSYRTLESPDRLVVVAA